MCESTSESAEIADSGRKGITACEQSTISHEQSYGLLRLNLLSQTVGFDRIDAAMNKPVNLLMFYFWIKLSMKMPNYLTKTD